MIPVLITGAHGQLGRELQRLAGKDFNLIPTDLDELDITDHAAIMKFLAEHPCKYIVNCAAYTAVDRAEDEPEMAARVNALAPGLLAEVATAQEIQLIHISTDYVFDGQAIRPYQEEDPVNPQSVYGKTKREGELAVQKTGLGIIIRTSWLYSVFGHNFVKTMLRLAGERDEIRVVMDQAGSPTNARDLAEGILKMIRQEDRQGNEPRLDLYHFSNQGLCSWYEFARSIMDLSGNPCRITAIPSSDYPTKAPRPKFSGFSKKKWMSDYGWKIPSWKESLALCIDELKTL